MPDPLQKLMAAFRAINPGLEEPELDYLAEHMSISTASSRALIVEPNRVQHHLYFLASGLVRGFYVDDAGEEITIRFVNDTGWITHYSAFVSRTPSKYAFQALEPSEIVALPYAIIQEGYAKYGGLEKFGRLTAELVLIAQQQRIESFQFSTAEERYLAFVEDYPDLFGRVSVSHLSSYLGIKRQSLTRIRKKLATR